MLVVSNTSTILNLAIIDQLALLREQCGQVHIPKAVIDELRVDEDLPGSHSVRDAIHAGWLKVENVRDQKLIRLLTRSLDNGEAEAIALALELKADLILLDERDARKEAKASSLNVTGVLGVLLKARRAGQLLSLRQAVQDVIHQAGFRIGAKLLTEIESLPEYQDDWKPEKKTREGGTRYESTHEIKKRRPRGSIAEPSVKQIVPVSNRHAKRSMTEPSVEKIEPVAIVRRDRRQL